MADINRYSPLVVPETLTGKNRSFAIQLKDLIADLYKKAASLLRSVTKLESEKANDSDVVHKTSAETIGGVKTFSDEPIFATAATNGEINFKTKTTSVRSGTIGYSGASTSEGEYSQGRFRFYQMSPKSNGSALTDYYETYQLPKVDAGMSAGKTYDIITTKGGTYKPIYYKEVTGTTTVNGNLNLGVSHSDYILVGALCTTTDSMCTPCRYNATNWGVHVCKNLAAGTAITSTSVTVRAYFMPVAGVPEI